MKTAQERTPASPGHTRVSDIESHDCRAVSGILNRIGDKWSVLIIQRLGEGSRRFNEIKRIIDGISQRMLTLTLRNLERDGLVSRTVTPTVPPRVDYALTELGRDLLVPVSALGQWAIQHTPCIEAARARFDASEAAETPQQDRVSAG
ncbi:MAG: helix-turn-helix domain-containing protein [Alphaproteobacteria bacterium]|nr:helix-turn-helix domain-containing protein [Alphaproteobacteria bacterium]